MKGPATLISAALLLSLSLFNVANAKAHHHNPMWMCETNASNADNDADKKNDMSKKGMSAKDAFNYAYKHCHDCTKITCTQESK